MASANNHYRSWTVVEYADDQDTSDFPSKSTIDCDDSSSSSNVDGNQNGSLFGNSKFNLVQFAKSNPNEQQLYNLKVLLANSLGVAIKDIMMLNIIDIVIEFHGDIFDINKYTQLQSSDAKPIYFLIKRENINLSGLLRSSHDDILQCLQVDGEILKHVVMYLDHHNGIEPQPLPKSIRSVHMKSICRDQWDADFIDGFDTNTIFEMIKAAKYLDIQSLSKLASAKIASMIRLNQYTKKCWLESWKRKEMQNKTTKRKQRMQSRRRKRRTHSLMNQMDFVE